MSISPHLESLRELVGSRLLLVPGVAAIVRNGRGELLLHRRADDGSWSLPAGAIDPGESPAEAVVREVHEETGLEVVPERVRGVFGGERYRHVYPNGDETEYTVVVFECRTTGGELRAVDGEAVEFRYFQPDRMPKLGLPYPRELFEIDGEERVLF